MQSYDTDRHSPAGQRCGALREDLHDGVHSCQLLKHLEAAADDQSPAGGSVSEHAQNDNSS